MTELIFKKKNIIYNKLRGFEAAEAWHLYHYFKQIFDFENNNTKKYKNLLFYKYLIFFELIVFFKKKSITVCELGSSIFEMITGLQTINKSKGNKINIKKIKFFGIEKSDIFKFFSKRFFFHYNIKFKKIRDKFKTDFLFDRSVSNYIFNNEVELINFYQKHNLILSNLMTVTNNKKKIKGNFDFDKITIFNLDVLNKKLSKINYQIVYLFGKKNPNTNKMMIKSNKNNLHLDGFFLVGQKIMVDEVMKSNIFYKLNIHPIKIENLKKNNFYKIKN